MKSTPSAVSVKCTVFAATSRQIALGLTPAKEAASSGDTMRTGFAQAAQNASWSHGGGRTIVIFRRSRKTLVLVLIFGINRI